MNSNLERLVHEMNPILHEGEWVFCELGAGTAPADALAVFRESEATTIVIPRGRAGELGLEPRYLAAWITLTVHSELDAVGFLAVISRALAGEGISCNVFSAVYHDHLFVPFDQGEKALAVLKRLQRAGDPLPYLS